MRTPQCRLARHAPPRRFCPRPACANGRRRASGSANQSPRAPRPAAPAPRCPSGMLQSNRSGGRVSSLARSPTMVAAVLSGSMSSTSLRATRRSPASERACPPSGEVASGGAALSTSARRYRLPSRTVGVANTCDLLHYLCREHKGERHNPTFYYTSAPAWSPAVAGPVVDRASVNVAAGVPEARLAAAALASQGGAASAGWAWACKVPLSRAKCVERGVQE
jgi:hypothetical protein